MTGKIVKTLRATACLAGGFIIASPAQAAPLAQAVLIDTFDTPVYVTSAPGQPTLLFVVEQPGRIRVLQNEIKKTKPFLDVTSRVSFDNGERGLLSMAFAPDYATSGLFYIAYTNTTGDIEVDEYKRSTDVVAAPKSRRKLLTISHREAGNHNGGQLQFGPDGLLYISTGDGGEVFPRGKYSRDLTKLLGKILRIDPRPDGNKPYTIPPDNPFVGTSNKPEIFAYGLRNPWRFSFDGQRIAIGDVGQNAEEEIDFLTLKQARGANFGWPAFEGNEPFDNIQPTPPDPPMFPMRTYPHSNGRCAVIGGYVSKDPDIPALKGRYIYADLCNGQLRSFEPDVKNQKALGDVPVGIVATFISSFGIGPDRRMYLTQTTGELKRVDPAGP